MTVQVVPLVGDLLVLLTAAIVLVLFTMAIVQLARRRTPAALRLGGVLGGVVVLYGAALVGVGLANGPRQLKAGDSKCFDDWCATMVGARQDVATGRLLVGVRLENRGRGKAMRADLARAYVEGPGGGSVAPQDAHELQVFLRPGEHADVELVFDAAPDTSGRRFVVVEDAETVGPGTFTIGGEGSPFHGKAGWPLVTS
ncbi:MAG: hypothetical protein ACR2MZ_14860 [Candidatus Dormibacter sp.]|uniref:hypothetical protein n=1 Tax=Candidatus Dormibacter sp. TaxID=2973982 RepID=UPI000DB45070|nr:MAG: hypothetical protein DLM66_07200 [Candidatus Dormibacteraeota bacterium]